MFSNLKLEGDVDAALLSFERLFKMVSLMFFAKVLLPIPGSPTGTKNSLVTWRIYSVLTRSTRNFYKAYYICSGLHPKGTATSC